MAAPPDPLQPLRDAWTIALNPNAHRLLRHAIDRGRLELADALEVSQATTRRSSAEDLAKRLEDADLLTRTADKRVTFVATPLGEAIGEFIANHAGVLPVAGSRPTVLILDDSERASLQEAGFELATALGRAAVEVAALRHRE
jgi:hypothetical protein